MTTAALYSRSDYVSAVAVALHDLPAGERDELIEELDGHLVALLAERPDADLIAELGSPAAYARELLTAAGLDGGTGTTRSSRVTQVVTRLAAVVDGRVPSWLAGLTPTLAPVWWVLRGYLAVIVVAAMLRDNPASSLDILWPTFLGVRWIGSVAILAVAAASVGLGQRRFDSMPARVGLVVANLCLLLAAAVSYLGISGGNTLGPSPVVEQTSYIPNCPQQVSNIYAYDASGKQLSDVRIYDQWGTPFDITKFGCNPGDNRFDPSRGNIYPYPKAVASLSPEQQAELDAQRAALDQAMNQVQHDGQSSSSEPSQSPPASLAPLPSVSPTPALSPTPG